MGAREVGASVGILVGARDVGAFVGWRVGVLLGGLVGILVGGLVGLKVGEAIENAASITRISLSVDGAPNSLFTLGANAKPIHRCAFAGSVGSDVVSTATRTGSIMSTEPNSAGEQ